MPKIKNSEGQAKNIEQRALLAKQMILCGVDKESLAKQLHQSRTTLWSRISNPGSFHLDEIRTIIKVLKIPENELLRFI